MNFDGLTAEQADFIKKYLKSVTLFNKKKSRDYNETLVAEYGAPRFFRPFSAGAWCERFEVGSGPMTGGLVDGFAPVVRPYGCYPCRLAA
jgi:hypothetical protein